jgi:hypothetical protein
MNQLAQSQFTAQLGWTNYLQCGHQLHVSDGSISASEMAFYQKRSSESDLKELIWLCRERYCYAFELTNSRANAPDSLFDRSVLDLGEFYLPWSGLCSLYRRLVFDPQIDFFEEQRTREMRKWEGFLEKECFARVSALSDWTRCVLETAGLLEARSTERYVRIADVFGELIECMEARYGNEVEPNEE